MLSRLHTLREVKRHILRVLTSSTGRLLHKRPVRNERLMLNEANHLIRVHRTAHVPQRAHVPALSQVYHRMHRLARDELDRPRFQAVLHERVRHHPRSHSLRLHHRLDLQVLAQRSQGPARLQDVQQSAVRVRFRHARCRIQVRLLFPRHLVHYISQAIQEEQGQEALGR